MIAIAVPVVSQTSSRMAWHADMLDVVTFLLLKMEYVDSLCMGSR